MDRDGWMALLGLGEHEVPQLLVTEGTWWRQRALDSRLSLLTGVRELGMPDLWLGWNGDVPVAYCPAYGAPRVVEPVHALALCGTPVVVQIGSCGGLQPHVRTGDVVLSERAAVGEGASQYYGGGASAAADLGLVAAAEPLLRERGVASHRGTTVSTSALLQQPPELVSSWAADGHLGVDMETSAVLTTATFFGIRAASLLFVWDELPGRSWTDAFSEQEQDAQRRANAAVFDVALLLGDPASGEDSPVSQ